MYISIFLLLACFLSLIWKYIFILKHQQSILVRYATKELGSRKKVNDILKINKTNGMKNYNILKGMQTENT